MIYTTGSGDLKAYKNDGTEVLPDPVTGELTLLNATTYYVELGGSNAPAIVETVLASAHLRWGALVAMVVTLETSNFPRKRAGGDVGPDDVTPWSAVAGDWIAEDPSTAEVSVVGTGNSSTGAVVTAGGTNAGGAIYHVGNLGSRRIRLKLVVTVGGPVRINRNAKLGA